MENSADTVEEVHTTSSSATFYGWKYKHFFVIMEEGKKNIRARCRLCAENKTLSLSCARKIHYLQLQEAFRKSS